MAPVERTLSWLGPGNIWTPNFQTNGTADILEVVKPLPLGLTESAVEAKEERFQVIEDHAAVQPRSGERI